MNKKNLRKGFTTVELVIVIAVIAILATALIPTFGTLIERANETADARTAESIYKDYITLNPAQNAGKSYFIEVNGKCFEVDAGSLNTEAGQTLPNDCYTKVTKDAETGALTTNKFHKDGKTDADCTNCK